MLNVNDDKFLYVSLFYYRPNNIIQRFNVEDCSDNEFGKTWRFPVCGRHEHYYDFRRWLNVTKEQFKSEELSDATYNEKWAMFRKSQEDDGCIDNFEILLLSNKGGLRNIIFSGGDSAEKRLLRRPRCGLKNIIHYRSGNLVTEETFAGVYSVVQDIPKAIDITMRTLGNPCYKGNFAVIDLKKFFETGEMSYTLS